MARDTAIFPQNCSYRTVWGINRNPLFLELGGNEKIRQKRCAVFKKIKCDHMCCVVGWRAMRCLATVRAAKQPLLCDSGDLKGCFLGKLYFSDFRFK